LFLVISLLVAGGAHFVAYQPTRNHFKALLVAGAAFAGAITLLALMYTTFLAPA
jgi:hypothetical protein